MAAPVTLITGTSSGLGQATALHLARKGHRVFATMRSPGRDAGPLLEAAKAEGLTLRVSQLDVCDPSSITSAVESVLREAGQIDVLVNNAGRGDLGAIELATNEQITGMFETNVFGPIRMCQAVLPSMRACGSGTIVNVTSVAGLVVGPADGLYSGTKHAFEAISEALALEVLQYGIRVAIIEPGFYATSIIDKAIGSVTAAGEAPYANVERRMSRHLRRWQGRSPGPAGGRRCHRARHHDRPAEAAVPDRRRCACLHDGAPEDVG